MPTFADNQNDKQHNMRHFLFLTVATLCLLSCHRSGTFEMTYNGEELLSAARQKIQLNDIDGSMEDIQNAMRIAKSEGDDSLYIEALYIERRGIICSFYSFFSKWFIDNC